MKARAMVIAALAAPLLTGCGGLGGSLGYGGGAGEVAASPPAVPASAPPPVASLPPAGAPAPAAVAPAPPAPPPIPTGSALGAVLGGPVGASLTESDRRAAWEAQLAALDTGKPRSWRGANHVYGSIEPGPETGAGCRSYAQTIYVAGRANHGQGVACRLPEGGWKATS